MLCLAIFVKMISPGVGSERFSAGWHQHSVIMPIKAGDPNFAEDSGRPHSALGPGVPDPPANSTVTLSPARHRLGDFRSVHAKAVLGGLHHEYSLARA